MKKLPVRICELVSVNSAKENNITQQLVKNRSKLYELNPRKKQACRQWFDKLVCQFFPSSTLVNFPPTPPDIPSPLCVCARSRLRPEGISSKFFLCLHVFVSASGLPLG
jgi:hypothetical protein